METEIVDPKDLHLEEADFAEIEYSKPTSLIFMLSCLLAYSIIICLPVYWNLDSEGSTGFIILYIIIFLVYIILMVNGHSMDFFFKRRLKKSLDYYRNVRISFDYDLGDFSYDPRDPPTLSPNIFYFYIIFVVEAVVLNYCTVFLFELFPNPTNLQVMFYSIGFIIVSFGFLTFVILQGIWNWNRNLNYFAESFYFLKAYIIGDEKDPVFKFTCKSLNSFFKLLHVNKIPINFDELKLEDLGWIIEFFSPENKAICEDLEDNLLRIFLHLKERKWLEALLSIEMIEKNLEEAKNNLGSTYLKKEYVEDESLVKKWIKPIQKEFISTIIKQIVPPAIILVYLLLQGSIY